MVSEPMISFSQLIEFFVFKSFHNDIALLLVLSLIVLLMYVGGYAQAVVLCLMDLHF